MYYIFIFFLSLADLIEWPDMKLNGGSVARGPAGNKPRLKYKIKYGHFLQIFVEVINSCNIYLFTCLSFRLSVNCMAGRSPYARGQYRC